MVLVCIVVVICVAIFVVMVVVVMFVIFNGPEIHKLLLVNMCMDVFFQNQKEAKGQG